MNDADRRRLIHVLEHIERIDDYCRGGRTELEQDRRTRDAVMHCLTVIGEALGALTPETYRLLESLPPGQPKALRNFLIHEYWRIDLDIVWATIVNDLPSLRRDIVQRLEERRRGG